MFSTTSTDLIPKRLNSSPTTMASAFHYPISCCFFIFFATLHTFNGDLPAAVSAKTRKPDSLALPVRKDKETLQYYTVLEMGSDGTAIYATIELGGHYFWFDCDKIGYNSSYYKAITCSSSRCKKASKVAACAMNNCLVNKRPGCSNETCSLYPYNPFTNSITYGLLIEDSVSVSNFTGLALGINVETRPFVFQCLDSTSNSITDGLAKVQYGPTGVVGLGSTPFALPTQLALGQKLPRNFALCFYDVFASEGLGNIFIGGGPYYMNLDTKNDVTKYLFKTPLIIKEFKREVVLKGEPFDEYFIGVKTIKIDGSVLHFENSANLLAIKDIKGVSYGGTSISTTVPYSVLHGSIYKPFVEAFVKKAALRNITRVAGVGKFGACFSSKTIHYTRVGPRVPTIDLVLQNKNVKWRIYGANSMVKINKDVLCLGFVDGGSNARTAVVIGGHQIENNLLEFDLPSSTLGFASLLAHNKTCMADRVLF